MDATSLNTCRANGTQSRTSIFEYTGILLSKGNGYGKLGEENNDYEIEDDSAGSKSNPASIPNNYEGIGYNSCSKAADDDDSTWLMYSSLILEPPPTQIRSPTLTQTTNATSPPPPIQTEYSQQKQQKQNQYQQELPTPQGTSSPDMQIDGNQTFNIFHPFFDPEMLSLFPNGEFPDISQFETTPMSLDYFDIDGYGEMANMSEGLRPHENIAESVVFE